jgi:hypothetical protein
VGNNHGFGTEILHGVEVEIESTLASENNVGVTVFDHYIYPYNLKGQIKTHGETEGGGVCMWW